MSKRINGSLLLLSIITLTIINILNVVITHYAQKNGSEFFFNLLNFRTTILVYIGLLLFVGQVWQHPLYKSRFKNNYEHLISALKYQTTFFILFILMSYVFSYSAYKLLGQPNLIFSYPLTQLYSYFLFMISFNTLFIFIYDITLNHTMSYLILVPIYCISIIITRQGQEIGSLSNIILFLVQTSCEYGKNISWFVYLSLSIASSLIGIILIYK